MFHLVQFFQRAPSQRPLVVCFSLVSFALIVTILLSLLLGAGSVGISESWQVLLGQGSDEAAFIVSELRCSRTLVALVVGMALGVAGALMQAVARNPLAEPGLLGVSAGASFAVAMALLMGASAATLSAGVAQIGALVAVFLSWLPLVCKVNLKTLCAWSWRVPHSVHCLPHSPLFC
ncbi:FecCD transport family [Marinomonas fungiae]|uniref:FecCD transport family n=1 Tax=Marinomonas fungiae TaxID=1137284 RepID=A0A0K6IQE0_9GAMM|nr:FecCD transport family [Marinomonas fungiae]